MAVVIPTAVISVSRSEVGVASIPLVTVRGRYVFVVLMPAELLSLLLLLLGKLIALQTVLLCDVAASNA